MTRQRLSNHFVIEEFDSRDGQKVPDEYIRDLKRVCREFLEPMRRKFGPVTIHSGYRSKSHNSNVGGARSSYHVYVLRSPGSGVATDFSCRRGNPRRWYRRAKRIRRRNWSRFKRFNPFGGNGGIGYYPRGGFIHFDSRNYPANWEGP